MPYGVFRVKAVGYDVRGVEVPPVSVSDDICLHSGLTEPLLQPLFNHQVFSGLKSELDEGAPQVIDVGVDVQMVGVHGGDDGSFRMQVQERAVEFIGLGYDDIVVTQQKVGAVVLGDAAQKRRAAFARLGEDVGQHGAGGRLAVSTGDSQTPLARGYLSEGLCPFYYAVAVCPDVDHLSHVGRHGRCVDDQSLLRCGRNQ